MNAFHNSSARRADFKKFLNAVKFAPSKVCDALAAFEAEYNAAQAEREKYSPDAVEALVRSIRERARATPNPANISALAALDAEGLRRRYADASNEIRGVVDAVLEKWKGVAVSLRDAVLPIVDAEIENVEASGRALAEGYGSTYDPASDLVLGGLGVWRRGLLETFTEGRAHRPDTIREWFGELRAKKLF